MIHRFHSFPTFPLHITGRCPNPEWTQLPLKKVWKVFCDVLHGFHQDRPLQTHAFVLMDNHYHWLCIDENFKDDPFFFNWFHEVISFELFHLQCSNSNADPQFRFFEGPAKITVIDHPQVYRNTYNYIYRNPVMAGLAASAEKYPYSTLPMVLGKRKMRFPCVDQMNLIYHPQDVLEKINLF
ncbi:hypothetical protein K2X05_00075 [bacterium]|nr:hypothetical protein [bacterium]